MFPSAQLIQMKQIQSSRPLRSACQRCLSKTSAVVSKTCLFAIWPPSSVAALIAVTFAFRLFAPAPSLSTLKSRPRTQLSPQLSLQSSLIPIRCSAYPSLAPSSHQSSFLLIPSALLPPPPPPAQALLAAAGACCCHRSHTCPLHPACLDSLQVPPVIQLHPRHVIRSVAPHCLCWNQLGVERRRLPRKGQPITVAAFGRKALTFVSSCWGAVGPCGSWWSSSWPCCSCICFISRRFFAGAGVWRGRERSDA